MRSVFLRACAPGVAWLTALGCGAGNLQQDQHPAVVELQELINRTVATHDAVAGAALAVDCPAIGLQWEGAAGEADPTTRAPMTSDTPVLIASNTKTFVAAAILRLVEGAAIGLDDPLSEHLPQGYLQTLQDDGYDPRAMTVRHLLTHTAGLYDHTDSDNYLDRILADPLHRWTRTEQLEAATAWGDPIGVPGEYYKYSDTGYILLGEIIERASGETMPRAIRRLVGFDRLGLGSTWFETLEDRPPGSADIAHQYSGDIDATTVDVSIDLYGGGGLASTMPDLRRFMRALFTGEVFLHDDTLATMLSTLDGVSPRPGATERELAPGMYRMGLWRAVEDGLVTYRHTGYWGTIAMYVPELDAAIAATVNQNRAKTALQDVATATIEIVRSARGSSSHDAAGDYTANGS